MRSFCCCTVGIVVIEAENIDLFGSTNTLPRRYRMATLDEITKEKQRISEVLARVDDMQREKLVGQLGELEATERVVALQRGHAGKEAGLSQNADYGHEGGRPGATTRAPAHDHCKTRWRQAQLVEPRRPGPCAGNRQDAAGNRRCMQGRSRQPCRRRPFPAQAGGPHRRARWETLRRTVNQPCCGSASGAGGSQGGCWGSGIDVSLTALGSTSSR